MTEDANKVEVVYTTNDVYEAEIIRNQLHDAGIKCELDGDSQGGFTEIVETKLLVRAEDTQRMQKAMQAAASQVSLKAQQEGSCGTIKSEKKGSRP